MHTAVVEGIASVLLAGSSRLEVVVHLGMPAEGIEVLLVGSILGSTC